MAEQYANFATTLLNGAINNSTTTVVVDDGSVFPSTGNFRIVIDSEIMVCTSRSSNTLTVTRGQEGTTGASHVDDSVVKSPLTVESLHKLIEDNNLTNLAASRPAASQPGRLYLPTDESVILRDSGSAWHPFGPIARLWNPNDQSWSWGNQGAATLTTREFSQTILFTNPGSGSGLLVRQKTPPTPPYTITALFQIMGTLSDFQNACLGFRNSSDNKEKWIRCWNAYGSTNVIYVSKAASWGTSGSSNPASSNIPVFPLMLWLQIEDDNTNHFYRYSLDGINFLQVFTDGRTNHMSAPSHVFWGTEADGFSGNVKRINLLSWREH